MNLRCIVLNCSISFSVTIFALIAERVSKKRAHGVTLGDGAKRGQELDFVILESAFQLSSLCD